MLLWNCISKDDKLSNCYTINIYACTHFIFSQEASPTTLVAPRINLLRVHNQQPIVQHITWGKTVSGLLMANKVEAGLK